MRAILVAVIGLVATGLVGSEAQANDGVFGGTGVHPMPLTTSDVRMVDEIVRLRLDHQGDAWNVDASFFFENTSDKSVTLTIGFPFPVFHGEEEVTVPAQAKQPKPNQPMVWDFRTWVRGKPVKAKRSKTEVNPALVAQDYDFAYLWDVTFEPGERVPIRNTYRHGISAVVGGLVIASYVLKTGKLWKGERIGHSRLSIEVPGHRYTLCEASHSGFDALQPKGLVVSPMHGEPGIEVHGSFHEFAPSENLEVCFQDLDAFAEMEFAINLDQTKLSDKSPRELRILRNTVYALYGYVFKDADLRAHFRKQWWYRPNPKFSPTVLGAEEREFIELVKSVEKSKKAQ